MTSDDPFRPPDDDLDGLEFLRDEGLYMLALFRRIRERSKRDLVVELVRTLVSDQSEHNGAD